MFAVDAIAQIFVVGVCIVVGACWLCRGFIVGNHCNNDDDDAHTDLRSLSPLNARNLLPHDVQILDQDGRVITTLKSAGRARLDADRDTARWAEAEHPGGYEDATGSTHTCQVPIYETPDAVYMDGVDLVIPADIDTNDDIIVPYEVAEHLRNNYREFFGMCRNIYSVNTYSNGVERGAQSDAIRTYGLIQYCNLSPNSD